MFENASQKVDTYSKVSLLFLVSDAWEFFAIASHDVSHVAIPF